jgi:hypothetical protein
VTSRATIHSVCATCAQKSPLVVEQRIENGTLKWFETFACPCGHGFEAAGNGLPANGIRNRILQQCGEAELYLYKLDKNKLSPVAMRLVQVLERQMIDVLELLETIPCKVYVGTPTEVEFVVAALAEFELETKVMHHLPTLLDE